MEDSRSGPGAIDYVIAAGILVVFVVILLLAIHKTTRVRCDHCGGSGRVVAQ